MLSILVESDSCPTQNTPGPRSPGAATVTDTGVVERLSHNSKFSNLIISANMTKKNHAVKQEIFGCVKKMDDTEMKLKAQGSGFGASPPAATPQAGFSAAASRGVVSQRVGQTSWGYRNNSDIKPPLPVVDPERFYRSGEK